MWLKISLLFILSFTLANAQIQGFDSRFIHKVTSADPIPEKYQGRRSAPYLLFRFYKTFISSQDIPEVCHFYPSCSQYGLDAIHIKGPFIGTLATFDRLTRCNSSQKEEDYLFDYDKRKFIDPVE